MVTETLIAKATAKLTCSWVLFVETGYAVDGKTDNVGCAYNRKG